MSHSRVSPVKWNACQQLNRKRRGLRTTFELGLVLMSLFTRNAKNQEAQLWIQMRNEERPLIPSFTNDNRRAAVKVAYTYH